MIHNIDAIYDHGVFRPVEPLALPEGIMVRLRVEETNGGPSAGTSRRLDALFAALDHAHNTEPIGSLRRDELHDRDILR
jgi:predicted DNA-binding antitoxin AbrB/MazE fold protein